jgi:hypothetical protein
MSNSLPTNTTRTAAAFPVAHTTASPEFRLPPSSPNAGLPTQEWRPVDSARTLHNPTTINNTPNVQSPVAVSQNVRSPISGTPIVQSPLTSPQNSHTPIAGTPNVQPSSPGRSEQVSHNPDGSVTRTVQHVSSDGSGVRTSFSMSSSSSSSGASNQMPAMQPSHPTVLKPPTMFNMPNQETAPHMPSMVQANPHDAAQHMMQHPNGLMR